MERDSAEPLAPELREAEGSVDKTLAEACDNTKPASEVDTNELVRVDELLEQASDAVKRTISLRRRRRADRAAREAARAAMADVEIEVSAEATHRILRDARGVRWDVFAVYPEPQFLAHAKLRGAFSQGWLCFDSASEKRRLSPIPSQWERLSNEQLAKLAEGAEVASSKSARSREAAGPEEQRRSK